MPKWLIVNLLFLTPVLAGLDVAVVLWLGETVLVGRRESTSGIIRRSEVVDTGVSGPRFRPLVQFDYEVDGRTHRGKLIYFGSDRVLMSQRLDAEAAIAPFAVGTTHEIYYLVSDPTVAALNRDAAGDAAIPALVATPFHAILAALWLAAGQILRRKRWIAKLANSGSPVPAAPPGFALGEADGGVRISAPKVSSITGAVIGFGAGTGVSLFAGIALVFGTSLTAEQLLAGMAIVGLLGTTAGFWASRSLGGRGGVSLIVDPVERRIAHSHARVTQAGISWLEGVRGVELREKIVESTDDAGKTTRQTKYVVWARHRGGKIDLHEFGSEPSAARCLAAWLRVVLGLRTAG